MTSNNIIMAKPGVNTSVDYTLPESDSAKLSFAPEDINGLSLDGSGGLVISFVEGGSVTISNFQSFIDNGNILSLADGTNVDPKLLFNALGGESTNPFVSSDALRIGVPADGTTQEITLESGKKYVLNFDLSETQGAEVKNGDMVIGFANGGKIILNDYETAMAGKQPPELSLTSKTCVVTGDQLITNIQALAAAAPAEELVVVVEEETSKHKSKIAAADMNGADDIGPGNETDLGYQAAKVEPSAGEVDMAKAAQELADVEPAAGEAGGAGARNSGYGLGSRPGADPFTGKPYIGPINATQLGYKAPELQPSVFAVPPKTNSNPLAIGPNSQFLDETNLSTGPISKSGTISINFGADGPGGINPNGNFSSSGSKTGGNLTSNGDAIKVEVVGNNYEGRTPAGDLVFKLTVDSLTGEYTFTQYLPLDHADGTNPNDTINLQFGIIAYDGDGDSINTTVNITIADDAPSIEGAEKTVDETDLGPLVVSGNLAVNFGQDGEGAVTTAGTFGSSGSQKGGILSSDGHPITVTWTANGYEGVANGVVIFTLAISATGGYTYTQYGNLDHADPNDPNDIITLTFGAKITDFDGDTDVSNIVINVKDDAPRFVDCGCGNNPTPGHAVEIIDETNLVGGVIVETGAIAVDFGVDGPGTFALTPGSFQSSGSQKDGKLTHNGVPVVVTLEDGVYVGKAGNVVVFKLEIDKSTGGYTFTLLDNLDHADVNDPNDIITLKFGVTAADGEGDSIHGSITVHVKDDAPIANNDVNTFDTTGGSVANGNVITGLNGGPGAADKLSQDDGNKLVKIAFEGNEVDVPAVGTATINGTYGKLTISADGTYSYEPFATTSGGTVTEKKFIAGPALPDFEFEALDPAEQAAKGIAPGNLDVSAGDTIHINFVKENATNHNSVGVFTVDATGKITIGKVMVKDTETAGMATVSHTVTGDAVKVGLFLISGWGAVDPVLSKLDYDKGSLSVVYGYGTAGARPATINDNAADIKLIYTTTGGAETVIDRTVFFSSERGGSSSLNPKGDVHVVSGVPEGNDHVLRIGFEDSKDNDFNDAIFDVTIVNKDCGCGCGKDIKDVFTYTLQDGDGDRDTATLTLTGKDLTDDHPIFTAPGVEIVDETALAAGVITETGKVEVNFGADGPGTVDPAGTFSSTGSKLNNALTSNGVPVVVTVLGNTYTGKAGNVVVFTMTVNTNGSYEFKLFKPLDHADGTNPNDAIDLNFGLIATDCDGDQAKTNLVVRVKDDAPDAKDDTVNVNENGTATGNVMTNDLVGQDSPGTITQVTYKGTTYTVPNSGNLTINADHGTLTIDKNGAYTYVAKSVSSDQKDNFTYTLRDFDGDIDTAKLEVCVLNKNDVPEIIKPADEIVDETNLSGGVITETGKVTANFFGEGPGVFAGNGSFTSTGSKLGGALTHNGTPVDVTMLGDTYTGKAGTVTIFTLKVNSDGSYEFKLFDNIDHADGSNPNDIINLNFGIKATDTSGDSVSTTLTVQVKDDAPTISGSAGTVDETNLSATTPLIHTGTLAHSFGQDGAGSLVVGNASDFVAGGSLKGGALSSNGVAIKVTLEGGVYVGKAGAATVFTLTVKADGSYEYKQFKNLDHADASNPNDEITLKFDAKIVDFDGDSARAPITITVRDDAPTFPPENPENPPEDPNNPPGNDDPALGNGYRIVDETNLSGGNIVTTGNLNANFGADAPGSYALKPGSFTSHGSKTGGNLTSGGVPVVVTLEGGKFVGKAGSTTVFTLELNTTTGAYKFTLLDNLDHADGSNPNDVINLVFGVTASDSEGDTASSTIRIDVRDDAPDAKDDTVNVNENGTATGNVMTNDLVGQDSPGTITQVVYKGTTYTLPVNGSALVIAADHGTLTINNKGAYTYVAKNVNSDQVDRFTYTLRDHDGDTDTAKLDVCIKNGNDVPEIIKPADEIVDETNLSGGAITETGAVTANFFGEGPGTFGANGSFTSSGSKLGGNLTHNGTAVNVSVSGNTYTGTAGGVTIFTLVVATDGSYAFKLFKPLDHADPNDQNDIINLNFGIKATDTSGDTVSTTLTVKVKDDAPDAKDDTVNVNENGTATGNVMTNDLVGQDSPGTITQVTYKGTTYTVPNSGNLTINADHGTLTIDKNGVYTYVAKSVSSDQKDNFTYTLRDFDGDIDTAKLEVCVLNKNDVPTIIKPDDKIVDETNLSSGTITQTGKVVANFYSETGTVAGNGSFTSTGSKLGGNLTYHGTPVNVTLSGNTYTGTAGGVTIFTLAVATDGSYTFKLLKPLDHADGSNPNDIINLNFGIKATDTSGDTVSTTLTVQVKDDAPIARADYCTLYTHENSVTSNALTNDSFGQDGAGRITQISFGSTTVDVPASGTATIYGSYGYVTLAANGAYTYTLTNKSAPVTSENFSYKIVDYDGDSSSALMQFNIVKYAGGVSTGSEGNDVMYGISGNDVMYGNGGDDWLYGNNGHDTIYGGAGNDRIVGGLGNDILYGGSGADTFVYQTINDGLDTIKDFNKGEGDKLDLSALLTGFDPLTESINDFVFATQSGGSTTISVNMAGTGAGGATALAVLEGVNITVTDLFNSGGIIH